MSFEQFTTDFMKLAKRLTEEQRLFAINALKAVENVPNRYENGCVCPHCGKSHIRKFGKARGKQRFLCMDCDKTFSENTKTVFYSTKKSIELWLSYIELMVTGLSHEQVGVLVAVDRDKNIISKVYGHGKISKGQVKDVLGGFIKPNSQMITDSCRAYIKFAKENDIKLTQILTGKRSLGKYHINNVNSYHSGLKNFIRKFNGISTKYIEHCLNWFKWIKSSNDNMLLIKECLFNV